MWDPGGWRCHPCYHPCRHPVLFGALESCRWRLDGDYTSSTAAMDKATRGAHPPSHPPTHTRPRVFGGPESCQRSLDDDYTSSATVFDKSIGVALVGSRGWRCHPLVGFCLKMSGMGEGGFLCYLVATCIVYAFACRPTLGTKG